MSNSPIQNERGYMLLILALILIPFVLLLGYHAQKNSSSSNNSNNQFCAPEVDQNGNFKADSPYIQAPSYTHTLREPFPKLNNDLKYYRLVKARVPILDVHNEYDKQWLRDPQGPTELNYPFYCNPGGNSNATDIHRHFCQWIHKGVVPSTNSSGAVQYGVQYPMSWSRSPGESSSFKTNLDKQDHQIFFADYQLIFLIHLDQNGNPIILDNPDQNAEFKHFKIVDVYQQAVDKDSAQPGAKPLPPEAISCKDPGSFFGQSNVSATLNIQPKGNSSTDKRQLQLEYFFPLSTPVETSWYYPNCKPAIYLYPTQTTQVNVKVTTKGILAYTDPIYNPETGWNVTASPGGLLTTNQLPVTSYPYLYYESKIPDKLVKKPTQGFIVTYNDLPQLYDQILPKLGLIDKEAKEFKDYWTKALHFSSYYFVGIIPQSDVDQMEPLTINPKPQTEIRVRTFFQALSESEALALIPQISLPTLITPTRSGFTLVEWGGMVKNDKDHPFTCSQ